jgi:hypothetical protein
MQVVKYEYSEYAGKKYPKVSEKEAVLLSEIGLGQIPTATEFVEYIAEAYGASQSGIWYTLKKLKGKRLLDFTEKGESSRPLTLTEDGINVLRRGARNAGAGQYVMRGVAQISV